jgi:hypothetical protein
VRADQPASVGSLTQSGGCMQVQQAARSPRQHSQGACTASQATQHQAHVLSSQLSFPAAAQRSQYRPLHHIRSHRTSMHKLMAVPHRAALLPVLLSCMLRANALQLQSKASAPSVL